MNFVLSGNDLKTNPKNSAAEIAQKIPANTIKADEQSPDTSCR